MRGIGLFDTVALSRDSHLRPNRKILEKFDAQYYPKGASIEDCRKVVVNPPPHSHQPRITISRRNNLYYFRPEVSIGAWLYGSNLHLPTTDDLPEFYEKLDHFVGERTGMVMNSKTARTARIDFTRDFRFEPASVNHIIEQYRQFRLPRRDTTLINGTTVNFDSRSLRRTRQRQTSIYSKYHEMASKGADPEELEMSVGLIRLEDKYLTNRAVSDLARTHRLPDHNAQHILTDTLYESVIGKLVSRLGLDTVGCSHAARVRSLFEAVGATVGGRTLVHLALERTIGKNYYTDPMFGASERTAKERSNLATNHGLIALE